MRYIPGAVRLKAALDYAEPSSNRSTHTFKKKKMKKDI